jgi:hypothetical protein
MYHSKLERSSLTVTSTQVYYLRAKLRGYPNGALTGLHSWPCMQILDWGGNYNCKKCYDTGPQFHKQQIHKVITLDGL